MTLTVLATWPSRVRSPLPGVVDSNTGPCLESTLTAPPCAAASPRSLHRAHACRFSSRLRQQLEGRVARGRRPERRRRRASRHGKVALHGELEPVEIRFQDLGLLLVGNWANPTLLAAAPLLERDRAAGGGVSHPLRV